ncbi:Glucose-methanol-choline oxidoreductase [Sergentomyia squamirostris]
MNALNVSCILMTLVIYFAAILIDPVSGIDCFKCVSFNGANKACDDPFHNNYSTAILESPCMGGRKGRDGLFPATSCIKIAGYYDDTGETITVRGCALDSGTLTTDTEIIRMSHCGRFYYDNRYVHGCLQSCNDADACNAASHLIPSSTVVILTLVQLLSFLQR